MSIFRSYVSSRSVVGSICTLNVIGQLFVTAVVFVSVGIGDEAGGRLAVLYVRVLTNKEVNIRKSILPPVKMAIFLPNGT